MKKLPIKKAKSGFTINDVLTYIAIIIVLLVIIDTIFPFLGKL